MTNGHLDCRPVFSDQGDLVSWLDLLIFILTYKGFLTRQTDGKATKVFATKEGARLRKPIEDAWKNLHQRYARVLGLNEGDRLTAMIDDASRKLSQQA
jgi:hypothetical protein